MRKRAVLDLRKPRKPAARRSEATGFFKNAALGSSVRRSDDARQFPVVVRGDEVGAGTDGGFPPRHGFLPRSEVVFRVPALVLGIDNPIQKIEAEKIAEPMSIAHELLQPFFRCFGPFAGVLLPAFLDK